MKGPERKHKKGACKVISMRGWREGKRLEETLGAGLFYQTLVIDQRRKDEEDQSQFEIAYTINAEDLSDDERFVQIGEEEILSPIMDNGANKLVPFQRQVIERYEFYDLSTDDIHVIYRIPRKPRYR